MTSSFDADDEAVRYLLGRLPSDRMQEIERRILEDDDFHEEVEILHEELLDKYVHDELNIQDRQFFQKTYLQSSFGQRKLRFANTLMRRTEPTEAVSSLTAVCPPSNRYAYLFVASLALAAGLGITSLYLSRQVEEERTHRTALQKELKDARALKDGSLIAVLSPGMRDQGSLPEVLLPAGVRTLQLALVVPKGFPAEASARLESDVGKILAIASDLRPETADDKRVLIATFLITDLQSGNYFVRIIGEPNSTGLSYPLKIRSSPNSLTSAPKK